MSDPLVYLSNYFVEEHLDDAVRTLAQQSPNDIALFLDESPPGHAARLMTALPPALAEHCLLLMDGERATATIASLSIDAAARLLSATDTDTRTKLLAGVEPTRARAILDKSKFEKGTAGAIADTSVRAYLATTTIGEVRKDLGAAAPPYIYVIDNDMRLVGVAHPTTLQLDDATPLHDLMETDVVRLNHHLPLSIVRKHPAWGLYECLPVVDGHNVFVGVVKHKTIRQIASSQPEKYVGEAAAETLLSLGELYWSIGSRLMFGGVLQARHNESTQEGDDVT